MISFARNFTKLRKEKELSQEEVAEKLGFSRAAIAKWETGASTPDVYVIGKIARCFGVTVDELLYGGDTKVSDREIQKQWIEIRNDLLNAIAFRDKESQLYNDYLQYCNCSLEREEHIDHMYDEGYRAWEELRYNDAIDLFEKVLVCGKVEAIYPLMRIFHETLEFYEGAEEWSYRVFIADKTIQYNRIVENELQRGNWMW